MKKRSNEFKKKDDKASSWYSVLEQPANDRVETISIELQAVFPDGSR